jgi:hypothetical protein
MVKLCGIINQAVELDLPQVVSGIQGSSVGMIEAISASTTNVLGCTGSNDDK